MESVGDKVDRLLLLKQSLNVKNIKRRIWRKSSLILLPIVFFILGVSFIIPIFTRQDLVSAVTTDAMWPEQHTDTGSDILNPSYIYEYDINGATFADQEVLEEIYDFDSTEGVGTGTSLYNAITDGNVIDGITVTIGAKGDKGASSADCRLSWDGGSSWTDYKTLGDDVLGAGESNFTFGASDDPWGRTWAKSEFSDANFKVELMCDDDVGDHGMWVNFLKVTVTHSSPPNSAPLISPSYNETPAHKSTGNSQGVGLSVYISDPNGDPLDWWINVSSDGNVTYWTANNGSADGNGTKTATVSNTTYNGTYFWNVTVFDGTVHTYKTFRYKIEADSYTYSPWYGVGSYEFWAGSGDDTWSDSGSNGLDADDAFSVFVIVGDGDTSDKLNLTNFGASIPGGSVIHGIQLMVDGKAGSGNYTYPSMQLFNEVGTLEGNIILGPRTNQTAYTDFVMTSNGTTVTMWGASISPSDFNDIDFGVQLAIHTAGGATGVFYADYFWIRAIYDPSPPTTETIVTDWFYPTNSSDKHMSGSVPHLAYLNNGSVALFSSGYQDYYEFINLTSSEIFLQEIPNNATIYGIEISVEGKTDENVSGENWIGISLSKDRCRSYTNWYNNTFSNSTYEVKTYGGLTDLWGEDSWTVSNLSDDRFRLVIKSNSSGKLFTYIDYIAIRVNYSYWTGEEVPYCTNSTPSFNQQDGNVNTQLYVNITDDDSDLMSVTVWTNEDSGNVIGTLSSQSNGIKHFDASSYFDTLDTEYWYWVNVSDNDGFTNKSFVFKTEEFPIDVEITMAGNKTGTGGPYRLPPDDTTLADSGYYPNASMQTEDYVCIELTAVPDGCTIEDVHVNWYNSSKTGAAAWINYSDMLSGAGDTYRWNSSGNITDIESGHWYSFDIQFNTTEFGNYIYSWNKRETYYDESQIGLFSIRFHRRYVQLDCTPQELPYAAFYLHSKDYYITGPSVGGSDLLPHEQSLEGSNHDIGLLNLDLPPDDMQNIWCSGFVGAWINESLCVNDVIDNIYMRLWVYSLDSDYNEWGYVANKRNYIHQNPRPFGEEFEYSYTKGITNVSVDVESLWPYVTFQEGINPLSNPQYHELVTVYQNISDVYIDESTMYEFVTVLNIVDDEENLGYFPSVSSNRSYASYLIFNIEWDNLNSTDWSGVGGSLGDYDGDGLSDWNELNTTFSNPFVNDSDNDGVSDYDEYLTGSDPNNHTDTIAVVYPSVIINFAGNLTDLGGPYWRPHNETVQLQGDFSSGYTTNNSMQQEGWLYINTTVTGTPTPTNVWLNMWNQSVFDGNYTIPLTNTGVTYWEVNTSGNYTLSPLYNYSFDIVANSTAGSTTVQWNKTIEGGSFHRRSARFNQTPINISYKPYYMYAVDGTGNTNTKDRMNHDQGYGPGNTATGIWNSTLPDDTIQNLYDNNVVGVWWDNQSCTMSDTLENLYVHSWVIAQSDTMRIGWQMSNESVDQTQTEYFDCNVSDNHSWYFYDGLGDYNNYSLEAKLIDVTDTPITDNNIYNLMVNAKPTLGHYPAMLCNRSMLTFIIPNVPSNNTLNNTDWKGIGGYLGDYDGDELSDWEELYVYYTNPFINDTDYDGYSDYEEVIPEGKDETYDPNNRSSSPLGDAYPYADTPSIPQLSYNVSQATSTFTVTVHDADGDNMDVDFYISENLADFVHYDEADTVADNTPVESTLPALKYDSVYSIRVNMIDIDNNNGSSYFTFYTTPYRTLFFNDTFRSSNWINYTVHGSWTDGRIDFTPSESLPGIVEIYPWEFTTTASGWQDSIDISDAVPADAVGIVVEMSNRHSTSSYYTGVRHPSDGDLQLAVTLKPQSSQMVYCGIANQEVDIRRQSDSVNLSIVGYIPAGMGEFIYPKKYIDPNDYGGYASWITVDADTINDPDPPLFTGDPEILLGFMIPQTTVYGSVRPVGSTDSRIGFHSTNFKGGFAVLCNADNEFQLYAPNYFMDFYVVGCLYSSGTYGFKNAYNATASVEGEFEKKDLTTPCNGDSPSGVFYESIPAGASYYNSLPHFVRNPDYSGYSGEAFHKKYYATYGWVSLNDLDELDQYRDFSSRYLYVMGYTYANGSKAGEGFALSENISRGAAYWDTLRVHTNHSNCNFTIINPLTEVVLFRNIQPNTDVDISNISQSTIRIKGQFNTTMSMYSWNISWTDVAPGEWQLTDTIHFDFGNVSSFDVSDIIHFDFGNTSDFNLANIIHFDFGNTSDFSLQDTIHFDFGNVSSFDLADTIHFDFGNSTTWNLKNIIHFDFGNSSDFNLANTIHFDFGNVSSFNLVDTIHFDFGNVSSFDVQDIIHFDFGNVTVAQFQLTDTIHFDFGNVSSFDVSDIIHFDFGNTSSFDLVDTIHFDFGNVSDFSLQDTIHFDFGNVSNWDNIEYIHFDFGNISIEQWQLTDTIHFDFGNVSSFDVSDIIHFDFGNTSSFDLVDTIHFDFGNSSSFDLSDIIHFDFGNTTAWYWVDTIHFDFGNDTELWNLVHIIHFDFGNVSTDPINVTNPYPENNSNFFSMQPTIAFTLSNTNGYNMNYSIYIGKDTQANTTILLTTVNNVTNGTYTYDNYYLATVLGETYWWRVVVEDNTTSISRSFVFNALVGGGSVVSTPGFELFSLCIAVGISFILIKRRRYET